MTLRARFPLKSVVVTAGLCSVIAACSATTGPFRPATFASIAPKAAPANAGEAAPKSSLPATIASALWGKPTDSAAENAEPTPATAPHQVAAGSIDDVKHYSAVGMASWYGAQFHGRPTADGETFNRLALTAAHLSLPLPSYVRVTNLENNRSITVRVNDRGPYSHNRLIDVSEQTAELLAFRHHGLTEVRVDYVGPAPVDANDGQMLLATYRGPQKQHATAVAQREEPQPTRVAYADEPKSDDGGGAIDELTTRPAVMNRITMAFNAASLAGN